MLETGELKASFVGVKVHNSFDEIKKKRMRRVKVE